MTNSLRLLLDEIATLANEIVSSAPRPLMTANADYEELFGGARDWLATYGRWRTTGQHDFVFFKPGQEPLTAIGDRLVAHVRFLLPAPTLWEEPSLAFLRSAPARERATRSRHASQVRLRRIIVC